MPNIFEQKVTVYDDPECAVNVHVSDACPDAIFLENAENESNPWANAINFRIDDAEKIIDAIRAAVVAARAHNAAKVAA